MTATVVLGPAAAAKMVSPRSSRSHRHRHFRDLGRRSVGDTAGHLVGQDRPRP